MAPALSEIVLAQRSAVRFVSDFIQLKVQNCTGSCSLREVEIWYWLCESKESIVLKLGIARDPQTRGRGRLSKLSKHLHLLLTQGKMLAQGRGRWEQTLTKADTKCPSKRVVRHIESKMKTAKEILVSVLPSCPSYKGVGCMSKELPSLIIGNLSKGVFEQRMGQFRFLGNYPPTPPLSQH